MQTGRVAPGNDPLRFHDSFSTGQPGLHPHSSVGTLETPTLSRAETLKSQLKRVYSFSSWAFPAPAKDEYPVHYADDNVDPNVDPNDNDPRTTPPNRISAIAGAFLCTCRHEDGIRPGADAAGHRLVFPPLRSTTSLAPYQHSPQSMVDLEAASSWLPRGSKGALRCINASSIDMSLEDSQSRASRLLRRSNMSLVSALWAERANDVVVETEAVPETDAEGSVCSNNYCLVAESDKDSHDVDAIPRTAWLNPSLVALHSLNMDHSADRLGGPEYALQFDGPAPRLTLSEDRIDEPRLERRSRMLGGESDLIRKGTMLLRRRKARRARDAARPAPQLPELSLGTDFDPSLGIDPNATLDALEPLDPQMPPRT